MNPIPLWVRALMVALLLVVLWAMVHAYNGWQQGIGEDRVRAEWAAAEKVAIEEELAQATRNAQETQRRLKAQKEAQDAHQKELDRARAAAGRADTAAGELREQVDRLAAAARAGACNPAAAGNGAAAGDPIGVLADVLRRADERAGVLARFGDESRAAGAECERQYDALTGGTP